MIRYLRLPEPALPDTVYLEQLTGAVYPDRQADIDHYWHVMNRLGTEASPSAATTTILHQILKNT
ncbi:MAG: helix-turn-helix protein [Actinomycetia bacterium]|nr:helix-turn-helix protein [Actinomycetes bacterium]